MEIKADKSILLKELAIAAKYRKKDGGAYTYFEATEDGLIVKSTNDEVYYTNILPLQVVGEEDLETVHEIIKPGVVAITSKIEEVLRKVPGKTITLKSENEKVSISADGFKANVATIEVDFKEAPSDTSGEAISSPMAFFKNIVQRTGFAYSTSESRPALKGLNIKSVDGTFHAVTTDTHRLAYYSEESTIQFGEITVPAKAFTSILDEFNDDEKLNMVSLKSYVKLSQDERIVYIQLLDGNYPDTTNLVKIDPNSNKITIESKAFLDAIDRALLFAKQDQKKNVSIVQMEQVDEGLRVFSKNSEGEIDTVIAIKSQSAKLEGKLAYQGAFLQDAIRAHGQKEVTLNVIDNNRPMYITSETAGVTQLVLPIRV